MKVDLHRIDDAFHMQATNDLGLTAEIDGSPEIGGGNKAFRPMQLLLASVGGCSSIDVIHLLRKQRQEVKDIKISVEGTRVENQIPAVFKKIHLHYHLVGDLDDNKVERACRLSMEKLCSVSMMLKGTVEITWSYEVTAEQLSAYFKNQQSMESKHFETKAIRQQTERTQYLEHSTPMFLTSSFTFPDGETMRDTFAGQGDGLIYSRYSNPNTDEFIAKVCQMEGAEAGFATASGMAAVFASMAAFLQSGDHVISSRAVFGSTHQILTQILSKWGVTHTYVDPEKVEDWDAAVQENTKMLVVESPSNPGLTLVDLEKAGQFAKRHNLIFNIDNCFASPYLQQPVKYGADLVVHSGTKWMDGQGRILGGIIVGRQQLIDEVTFFCRHTGPAMAPFNAWVLSKSLETLHVRLDRHCRNALELATFLENNESVAQVRYPHLPSHPQYDLAKQQMKLGGGLVSFEIKGDAEAAMRFLNALEFCSLSSNLGDSRTICTHPSSTTHSKLKEEERLAVGITPGFIRISVGLEHIEDLKADIGKALQQSSI